MHWSGTVASGEGWFAFQGDTADNTPHVHAAVQLAIARRTPVAITYDGGRVVGRALLVRSGVRHALEPAHGILLILFEPDAPEAAFLSDKAPQGRRRRPARRPRQPRRPAGRVRAVPRPLD